MCVTVKMENTEQKCVKVKERTHQLITLNISTHGCENGVHRTEYTPYLLWQSQPYRRSYMRQFCGTQLAFFFFLKWSVHIWKSIIYNRRDQDKHSRWWKKFEQIIILGLLCTLKDSKQNEFLLLQNISPPWFSQNILFLFFSNFIKTFSSENCSARIFSSNLFCSVRCSAAAILSPGSGWEWSRFCKI